VPIYLNWCLDSPLIDAGILFYRGFMKHVKIGSRTGFKSVALVDDDFYEYAITKKWHLVHGYPSRREKINGKSFGVFMHIEAMGGKKDGLVIDHINGDRLDNRKENLRYCTPEENAKNQARPISNKTGYKGVSRVNGKYLAHIGFNSKQLFIGRYKTARIAAKRYNHFAKILYGEFARLNEVGEHPNYKYEYYKRWKDKKINLSKGSNQ
jgi:hypothetical protein